MGIYLFRFLGNEINNKYINKILIVEMLCREWKFGDLIAVGRWFWVDKEGRFLSRGDMYWDWKDKKKLVKRGVEVCDRYFKKVSKVEVKVIRESNMR